jgi:hypothetical protein
MSILLPVPWITQLRQGYEDPTGCWYASACMVGFFFEQGPRRGLPRLFTRPLSDGRVGSYATGSAGAIAANPNHHEDLARNEGFAAVRDCETEHTYGLDKIESLLENHGPMFMYWFKKNGRPVHRSSRSAADGSYGHASVIVGTNASEIIFHDPEYTDESDGANRTMSMRDFNLSRQCWRWALMQRSGVTRVEVARRSAERRSA